MRTSIPSPQRTLRMQTAEEHLGCKPLLSKPIEGEKLYLYLIFSKEVVSTTLVREEEKVQWASLLLKQKALGCRDQVSQSRETSSTLMVTSKKLRPYFHAHPIEVLTNYPLCQVL